ncbi:MAG: carboxylating nicotinate-nucleotide diphosphorylase [Marinicaulis sp.]|nr:carboxylating nicotinate-nucleotide diphosphorylase [Marinicaulis sp.]NNE40317.1 carboxylating nicotinate-nucleotide diphosphorylase [Marinicaulis sp.]NNL89894.1 carboxylating nicotinate-nucleotide diphosphorylase [Marinicaulis sp.]
MTTIPPLSEIVIEDIVRRALKEDFGDAGDITTKSTIPADAQSKAVIAARQAGVIAGVQAGLAAFRLVDPTIEIKVAKGDGASVKKGDTVFELNGPSRGILSAERTALNFLGHLSGIATATAQFVNAIKNTGAKIAGTRKTTPGLRAVEKHAIRCGGGSSHRYGLYDAVMIKDNHIVAAGGFEKALAAAKSYVGHMVKVEVEIDRLDQLDAALKGGAHVIMLDNMSAEDMKKAVKRVGGRAILEASGNVTLETIRAIAETGVDVISSGWLTHSAPNLDLGMDFQ